MVDLIYDELLSNRRLSKEVSDATEKAFYWKKILSKYKDAKRVSYRDIGVGLQKLGSSLQEASVRQWLVDESHIVGPRDERTLSQIGELTGDQYLMNDTHSYFEACRIVRRQRKEILGLISKSIADCLCGHMPTKGSMLEIVYENVANLSELLELERITVLKKPISVPVNLINRPLSGEDINILTSSINH